jgi:hypothetical protein
MPVFGPRGVQPVQARAVQTPVAQRFISGPVLPRILLSEQFDGPLGGLSTLSTTGWSITGGTAVQSGGSLGILPSSGGTSALLTAPNLGETYVDVTFTYGTPGAYQSNSAESFTVELGWSSGTGASDSGYQFQFVPDAATNGLNNAYLIRVNAGTQTTLAFVDDGLAYPAGSIVYNRCIVRNDGTIEWYWWTTGAQPLTPQISVTDASPPAGLGTGLRFLALCDTPTQAQFLDNLVVLPVFVAVAAPITATGANTLGNATSSASAQNIIGVTGANTLGNATSSASVQNIIGVAGANTLDDATSSGSVQNIIGVAGANTLDDATSSGSAQNVSDGWQGGAGAVSAIAASGTFITGPATWAGPAATLAATGASGSFASAGASWTRSTSSVAMAALSGTFVPGAASWNRSAATVSLVAATRSFAPGPVVWSGAISSANASAVSGGFVVPSVPWVGSSSSIPIIATTGTFVAGAATWTRSTASVSAAAASGAFLPAPRVWSGNPCSAIHGATSGSFQAGIANWGGATCLVAFSVPSASFVPSPYGWPGSTSTVGASATTRTFIPGAAAWTGYPVSAHAAARAGSFSSASGEPGRVTLTARFVRPNVVQSGAGAAIDVPRISPSIRGVL